MIKIKKEQWALLIAILIMFVAIKYHNIYIDTLACMVSAAIIAYYMFQLRGLFYGKEK